VKVCIVCSAGGHLSEALAATAQVSAEIYYVTNDEPHVRQRLQGEQVFFVVDPHVSLWLYAVNLFQSARILWRNRPDVVISSGSGIALATCLLAKFYRRKLIFIESGARVTTPSRTGRMVYRFADLFLVQWKPMLKHYPKAIYGGLLL